jgi:DNA transposition AAA+ family ATPase
MPSFIASTIPRLRSFMLRSGLNRTDIAGMLGYHPGTIGRFLDGAYPNDTIEIRAGVKQLIDLHDCADANRLDRPHYKTKAFNEIRAAAFNALRNGSAYIVDGPPGTEKTESFRRIEHEINHSGQGRAVYVYARVAHTPKAFLSECCAAAGIPNTGDIDPLIRKLRFFLGRGRLLLIVDEAQHLAHDGLEVLRQLLDLPPYFGVVLGGSHDLTQRLQHWQMEQWRSRVRKSIFLTGPTDAECRTILRAELGELSDAECAEVIRDCKVNGQRVEMQRGKAVTKTYTYTSARDLFGAIEHAQQSLTLVSEQKESAA